MAWRDLTGASVTRPSPRGSLAFTWAAGKLFLHGGYTNNGGFVPSPSFFRLRNATLRNYGWRLRTLHTHGKAGHMNKDFIQSLRISMPLRAPGAPVLATPAALPCRASGPGSGPRFRGYVPNPRLRRGPFPVRERALRFGPA